MSEKCGTLCKHGFLEAVCERCKTADQIAVMTKERDSWKAKAEANARDAERYRWLRDDWWVNDAPEDLQPDLNMMHAETAEQFDAAVDASRSAVDAAMRKEKE